MSCCCTNLVNVDWSARRTLLPVELHSLRTLVESTNEPVQGESVRMWTGPVWL